MNFSFILDRQKRFDFMMGLSIVISSYTFFNQPFEGYFHYLVFLLYLPYFIGRYGWPPLPFRFILIPVVCSLLNFLTGNCEIFGFFKITVGMVLSVTFYNYLIIHYNYDFEKLFSLYLKPIYICCYLGLIELVSYRIGFTPGYSYNWLFNKWGLHTGSVFGLRVNSLFSEPSQFALMLLPAVFIAIEHVFTRNFRIMSARQCILVFVSVILTTSSTGYIGIFISLLLVGINRGKLTNLISILFLSVIMYFALYNMVDDFRLRVDSSVNLWTKDKYTIEDINTSSFVLYNNFNVCMSSFYEHPFIGTGLGSYPLAYEKYSLTKEEDFIIKKGFEFNSQDGNSLLIRSVTEMGIIGLVFWIVFIPRFFVKRNIATDNSEVEDNSWIYSGACLTIILGYLLRQGNYFINAFPFFVLMYFYIHKVGKSNKTEEVESEEEVEEELR